MVEGKPITKTQLFKTLFERYVYHLKEKVLDPFLENENFRLAIRDYDQESFKTYDKRIQNEVLFLIKNLCREIRIHRPGRQRNLHVRHRRRPGNEVCINNMISKSSSLTRSPTNAGFFQVDVT